MVRGERKANVLRCAMPCPCTVTLVDTRGIRHVAEVSAESVFDAAALAVYAFRHSRFVEDVGPATRLDVEVSGPITRHTVTVARLRRWG